MKRIQRLDLNTTNKIAAGEVVERPYSVVKELVENSIDSGATSITIEIEEGGEKLIRITDNGSGIHPEDVTIAFEAHATSKITTIEDIYKISTLGFRGEALPSIASVSKLKVLSKTKDFDYGIEALIEFGKLCSSVEKGCSNGTVIEVRDLFFNVPARKKFLKSSQREASIISDIITRLALSYPNISFTFINNGKTNFTTYGNDNLKDAIRVLYGKEVFNNIIEFEGCNDIVTIYGFVGNAEISRGSRNRQSIFVNKRYIKNKLITTAVENAFKSFLTVNKFPFFVIFIDIYSELIDVNVHPTKSEIKFQDERSLFKVIFDAVHKGISEDIKSKYAVEESLPNSEPQYFTEKFEQNSYFNASLNESLPLVKEQIENKSFTLKTDNILNKSTVDNIHSEDKIYDVPIDLKPSNENNKIFESYSAMNYDLSNDFKQKDCAVESIKDVMETNELVNQSPKFPSLRVIGQFNNTYIIAEAFKELYLIDQHAAHEKILFEKYRKDFKNSKVVSQILLTPVIIELITDDYIYFIENSDIFKEAGFKIETFGSNTISIREVPYILGKPDCKNLFIEILDNLKSLGSGKTEDVKFNKIASISCKAAVKAHDKLSEIEMNHILNELRFIDEPFTCPHGRPTILKFTLYDIEKKFKRIQ